MKQVFKSGVINTQEPKLKTKHLIEVLQDKTGLPEKDVKELVDTFFLCLKEVFLEHKNILFAGFFKMILIQRGSKYVRFIFRSASILYPIMKKLEERVDGLRGRNRDAYYGSATSKLEARKRIQEEAAAKGKPCEDF